MRPIRLAMVVVWLTGSVRAISAVPFLTGVDANFAPAMAAHGAIWKSGGPVVDLLPELRRNGANAFRVRVWTGQDGPSGLAYATRLASQAQQAGLQPYLVLFLSEDWSDLMKQPAPAAWRSLPFAEKLAEVKRYAQETAKHFLDAGINSDLYEIGNEIDFGLCGEFEDSWPNRVSTDYMGARIWSTVAALVRAAQDGILAANPRARFMLHLARWWEPDYAVAFLRVMDREAVRVDDLGLSYYPSSGLAPSNGLADFERSVQRIEQSRRLPVVVCEYAYPSQPNFAGQFSSWNKPVDGYALTEAGQVRWIADFLAYCRRNPDIRGAYYWSPEWNAPEMWMAFALFGPDGTAKPALASLSAGPVVVAPTDHNLRYVGRWDRRDPSVVHSHWGGAYLRCGFTGTTVAIDLAQREGLLVSIDDEPCRPLAAGQGITRLNAKPLTPGLHTLLAGTAMGARRGRAGWSSTAAAPPARRGRVR